MEGEGEGERSGISNPPRLADTKKGNAERRKGGRDKEKQEIENPPLYERTGDN